MATIYAAPAPIDEGLLGLIPERSELMATCSCPDAETFGVCKHALAVLLVLADELTIEPDLLARWRGGDPGDVPGGHAGAATSRSTSSGRCCAASGPLPDRVVIPPRLPVAMAATTDPRDADVAAAVAAAIAELRAR